MLADDEGMDVLDRDSEFGGQQESQSGRVEHRPRSENSAAVRRSSGLDRGVGRHVDRVGDEEKNRVRRHRQQLFGQSLCNLDVHRGKFEPRLAGMLLGARGDNDQVRSRGDRDVIASLDGARRCELGSVVEIENFGADLCPVGVVEDEGVG